MRSLRRRAVAVLCGLVAAAAVLVGALTSQYVGVTDRDEGILINSIARPSIPICSEEITYLSSQPNQTVAPLFCTSGALNRLAWDAMSGTPAIQGVYDIESDAGTTTFTPEAWALARLVH